MKRFIIAPDSFKGTMSADEAASIMQNAVLTHIPDAQIKCLPMADGGEGMVEAYLRILGGKRKNAWVSGPFGEPMEAFYGLLADNTAVIEMAACAGLPLVEGRRDPLHATTKGVGELIRFVEQEGAARIVMGIGGSATNDCGIGMAAALGYLFLDEKRQPVEPLACNMRRIRHIEKPDQLPAIPIMAACDVDNPLYGPAGATHTFGRQKGAEDDVLALLEAGIQNVTEVILHDLGVAVANVPGAGAAGGLGAGLIAFLGAELRPGIDLLLDTCGFDEMLQGCDIALTGEGRIDWQSAHGKVPVGIARRAKKADVPCIALCGAVGDGAQAVYEQGITAIFSAVRGASDFDGIKKTCHEDLAILADSVVRLLLAIEG